MHSGCMKILFLYRNHDLPTLPHPSFHPGFVQIKKKEGNCLRELGNRSLFTGEVTWLDHFRSDAGPINCRE